MIKETITYLALSVAVVAGGSALYNWHATPPLNTAQYAPLPQPKETVRIKRVKVPGPKEIITIEKPVVVEKLKLPDSIAQDQNKQVIATGEVPPYEGKTNVVAVIDTAKGTTELIAKQQPLPFLALKNGREIGIRGGVVASQDGTGYRADAYARWTFLRVGSIHTAIYGETNSRPEAKAMLDISYRW